MDIVKSFKSKERELSDKASLATATNDDIFEGPLELKYSIEISLSCMKRKWTNEFSRTTSARRAK